MKRVILGLLAGTFTLTAAQAAAPNYRIVETSRAFAQFLVEKHGTMIEPLSNVWDQSLDTATVLVPKNELTRLSMESHQLTHRCGGFIDLTDESPNSLVYNESETLAVQYALPALGRAKPAIVDALAEVRAGNLETFVAGYTHAFHTRKADTAEGAKAPLWLMNTWQSMADTMNPGLGVKVDTLRPPRGYSQPNVRITIPGSDPSLPIVVLGGHLDSINWRDGDAAPGADDDASGISALTEAYRVILKSNLKPKATIQIFGYAAEELGLLGSRALAEFYQSQGVKVRGAFQLDMVAYPGDSRKVTFINDNVDHDLTVWTEQLYGLYIGGEIQEEPCGYGCSDHASWKRYGYASVFPFEAKMDEMNGRIHTSRDLWTDGMDAEYAAQFAKLAVAFAAELSEAQ